ncbi:hypothetical protein BST91_08000 [Nonlabens tegetincola]|nr:hypothetical protein BST91_08000 [Nonlabens tegetincola]
MLKVYYKLSIRPEAATREDILSNYSLKSNEFVVLQVGANDGFDNDPIHKFIIRDNWSGVLIEPQQQVYVNYLTKTYSKIKGIKLINAAIDNQTGEKDMYIISFSKDRWATGLASFGEESMKKLIDSGYIDKHARLQNIRTPEKKDEYIAKVKVTTYSFHDVIKNNDMNHIDLLQIDAEGYDFELLKMFPFDLIKPVFLNFEFSHLNDNDKKDCYNFLSSIGYSYSKIGNDLFCELQSLNH